jgi:RNA polymerase sigma-70 factor, ECF subfamily
MARSPKISCKRRFCACGIARKAFTRNAAEYEEVDHPSLFIDMESDILASDKARMVRAALDKLTPNHREVIELAYFEGLTQTEMAERMGQPLGTVKTWVRSALKNLREEFGEAVVA